MNVTLKWTAFADTAADHYKLYKAITGFSIPFPNSLLVGDLFIFSATSQDRQIVTLTGTSISQVAANLNGARGIHATANLAGTTLFVRCTARDNPKLKTFPCTFLTHLSMTPSLIGTKENFQLITTIAFVPGTFNYSYTDLDGNALDFYHLTTVIGSTESLPTQDLQPILTPESICVIEGRVIDSQNDPVVGAEVKAQIQVPVGISDNAGILTGPKTVITDSLGRWSMPILQGQLVLFQIESVGYNSVVAVPATPFVLFKDLAPVDDAVFGDVNR